MEPEIVLVARKVFAILLLVFCFGWFVRNCIFIYFSKHFPGITFQGRYLVPSKPIVAREITNKFTRIAFVAIKIENWITLSGMLVSAIVILSFK